MTVGSQIASKRQEMLEIAKAALKKYVEVKEIDLPEETIDQITQEAISFFEVVSSEEDEEDNGSVNPDERQILLENEGGIAGGASIKLGNIQVNWQESLKFMGEFVMSAAGTAAQPWLLPFAALVCIQSARSVVKIDIQERLAMVLWIIGKSARPGESISTEAILLAGNSEYPKFNRPRLTRNELEIILEELEEIKCIRKTEDGQWELREKVTISSE